ncbi:hypothetical protein SAMN05216232_1435 [Virgibacillus subterraneus]|uniref:Uncharacterized protein n=1 Tax=Virgibacillus subterraneus TaxID=621109 RepID=A0A1H9C2B4_9BACI|nr:hypothetical protein [Virgibacillus subterraneus]SEP95376.1 hypothetical protein SAMN05216232_1435 [Virgibacillus subterraneus]
MEVNKEKLIKWAKKNKKMFENENVNGQAYKTNNILFYYVFYTKKWGSEQKGFSIISPNKFNKDEAINALNAHTYYALTANNIEDYGSFRAGLNFQLHSKMKEYLKSILDDGVLDNEKQINYQRAYGIMDSMLKLQDELIELWEESKQLLDCIKENGYFTDEEIERLKKLIPSFNLIQYKQLKPRYDFRKDFDVIYENRNNLKKYGSLIQNRMLNEMRSEVSEVGLERSLNELTKNIVVGNDYDSDNALYDKWYNALIRDIDARIEQDIKLLRYP